MRSQFEDSTVKITDLGESE
jgi:hypothetical protein